MHKCYKESPKSDKQDALLWSTAPPRLAQQTCRGLTHVPSLYATPSNLDLHHKPTHALTRTHHLLNWVGNIAQLGLRMLQRNCHCVLA